ncbi:MAG: transcription elongation factor GreA [Xanthobacteraceae bacterium]|nr:transcription elongation factor GreA [Xanthobacteraceae bacterium]
MSVAFVREESAEAASELPVRDRPISPHPNLVTPDGFAGLTRSMEEAQAAHEAALAIEDANERRRAAEPALRDMSYFSQRLASAQIIPRASARGTVAFGNTVSFSRDDGRRQVFKIVGEDEADPAKGSIAFISPVARALMGKSVGDTVTLGSHELEILAIA